MTTNLQKKRIHMSHQNIHYRLQLAWLYFARIRWVNKIRLRTLQEFLVYVNSNHNYK